MMSTKSQQSNQLFAQLYQTQVNLIQNPSKSSASDYRTRIDEIEFDQKHDTIANRQLFEYVLMPVLNASMRVNNNQGKTQIPEWSDLNECLLACVHSLLEKFSFSLDPNIFTDVLNVCSIVLSRYGDKPMSDELLNSCALVIKRIFQHSTDQIDDSFLSISSLTTIGLLVAKLLDILAESGSIQVRLDSLDAFKSILFRSERREDLQRRIGVIFASFLPGISIRLVQKFLLHENLKILNHKLICSALDVLSLVISAVFDDRLLDSTDFKAVFKSCLEVNTASNTTRNPEIESLIVNRAKSPQWLSQSSEKVFYLVEHLVNALLVHENEHVKIELVRMCARIAQTCYFSLNVYLDRLLKVLVTCAVDAGGDETSRVVTEATCAIEQLENKV